MLPSDHYEAVLADSAPALAREEALSRRVAWLRLALLAAAVAAFAFDDAAPAALLRVAGVLAAIGFAGAVWWHRRVKERVSSLRRRTAAARAGIARIERRWDDMPAPPTLDVGAGWRAILARDLGVTGDQSLLRLLDVSHPAFGGRRLLGWLLDDPPPVAVIDERQRSVAELRRRPELLLEAAARARHAGAPASLQALQAFEAWCADARPVAPRWAGPASAAIIVALAAVALWLAVAPGDAATTAVLMLVVVHLVVTGVVRARLNPRLGGLASAIGALRGALGVMSLVHDAEPAPGRFGTIRERVRGEGSVRAFGSLVQLLEWNHVRYSPMGHWMLNAVAGFDVHLAAAVERWRARHRANASAWLDDLADAEALLALATFAFEHPDRPFPTVSDEDAPRLDARALAHPLLAPARAVANDARLGGAGDVLVVSGPNMAGKTTHLRAIGLAVLMAQAGGVVTAGAMRLRRCRPRTSVRIEDDLGRGVSLFFAEVRRLRDVIADAEQPGAEPVLFLFDEILHGTNARDRRVATRAVLAALHAAGAAGLVTTHDAEIAIEGAEHIHFDGRVSRKADGSPALEFDYTARSGPAQHANALALLEQLGIKV